MAPSDILAYVAQIMQITGIPWFITGSIASIIYGEPRFTNDIDIVADLGEHHIPSLLDSFPPEDFYLSEDAMREALAYKSQFNIIHPASGFKIDMMVSRGDEFDRNRFSRMRRIRTRETLDLNVSSPEDVIIKKMEYYQIGSSEKHLRDILSMMKISAEIIDKSYIRSWVEKKGLDDIWEALEKREKENSAQKPPLFP
jgi:hypothetical protein